MALASSLRFNQQLVPDHVVIADADPLTSALVRDYVARVFPAARVTIAASLETVTATLEAGGVDFLVLDPDLPDSSGMATLEAINRHMQAIPVLIYAEEDDAGRAIQAVQAGAQDYLIKGRGNALTFKRIIQHSLERKRLVLESRRNEQMLLTFIKYAPAGIAVFDAGFRLLMASDRWCREHQIRPSDATGKAFTALFPHAGLKWPQLHRQCMQGEHISCEEDIFITNDGERHFIRWEMMPWFDVSDAIGGIVQFTEFVTEQRRIRMELEDAKSNLEQKVEERTQELVSAMLVAEEARAAKEEFFANMTHELRTPLHAIINFSRFGMKKLDRAPAEKIHEYFADILRSGERLLGLVDDLLDLTKHQAGKAELSIRPESLPELIRAVEREMSAILEAKDIALDVRIHPACRYALMDRRRIHQVLINLISNAVKFSPSRSVITVTVQDAAPYPPPGEIWQGGLQDMLAVSVLDQGSGIPEEELRTVFDEFAQSRKVQSGEFSGGTGLGLSICRRIVQAHGGEIWAERNPEGGALLRFILPKAENDEHRADKARSADT